MTVGHPVAVAGAPDRVLVSLLHFEAVGLRYGVEERGPVSRPVGQPHPGCIKSSQKGLTRTYISRGY